MQRRILDYIRGLKTDWTSATLGVVASAIAMGTVWLINDYRAWIDFGTGGTPPNFRGYMKITKFRVLRALSKDDLRDHSSLSAEGQSYLGSSLPQRLGPAPEIVPRTLPQRQQPAPLDPSIRQRLHALPSKYAESYPDILTLDKSNTEGRSTDAIYAKPDVPGRKHGGHDRILGHEIAHVHPAEDSLHVWLTEADAKKVMLAGWGERFPLSSLGMVHNGWMFVYAPRSMEEVDVVEDIVKAGIGHLIGQRL